MFHADSHVANMVAFVLLASLRVTMAFAAMPAPFGSVAPVRVRTALSLVITFAVCGAVGDSVPTASWTMSQAVHAAMFEALIGSVIGLTVRVTLAAADMAGSVAGQAMGLGFAESVNPTLGESALPTTYLLSSFATVVFFAFQGHHAVIGALATSFRTAPVGSEMDVLSRVGVVAMGGDMMARGLQIASPVLATMFIVQLGTALVTRIAPRVNLFTLAFSVAVGAGILVLWVSAPSLATAIDLQVRRLPDALAAVVGGG